MDVGATMRSRGLTREPVYYNVRLGCVVPISLGEEAQWREHLTYGLRSRKAYSVGFVSGQIVLAAFLQGLKATLVWVSRVSEKYPLDFQVDSWEGNLKSL